jgi:hypothetical protein
MGAGKVEEAAAEEKLVRPAAPKKPSNFDEVASLNDPDSDSFKYRASRQDYMEQLSEYMEKKEMVMEQRAQVSAAREKEVSDARRRVAQAKTELVKRGFSQSQADEFVDMFESSESITFDNLVDLYRVRKGVLPQTRASMKAAEVEARQKREKVPLPLGAVGGGEAISQSRVTAEEAFNLAIAQASKRKGKI